MDHKGRIENQAQRPTKKTEKEEASEIVTEMNETDDFHYTLLNHEQKTGEEVKKGKRNEGIETVDLCTQSPLLRKDEYNTPVSEMIDEDLEATIEELKLWLNIKNNYDLDRQDNTKISADILKKEEIEVFHKWNEWYKMGKLPFITLVQVMGKEAPNTKGVQRKWNEMIAILETHQENRKNGIRWKSK